MAMLLRCAFGRHMVEGEGEWRGVPDVLRSSFLLLVKELRRTSARLATLEAAAVINGQRPEENPMKTSEKDNHQQQMQKPSGVLKRMQDVETVSRLVMDRVAIIEHSLEQINEANTRREARWKRRVRRLHDEVKHLATLAGASSHAAGHASTPAAISLAATNPASPRRDHQCTCREGEEQTIEDSGRVSAGMNTCDDTRGVCGDNESQAIDNAALLCDPRLLASKSHVRAASTRTKSSRRAVDLRIEIPCSTPPNNHPESDQDWRQKRSAISKKLNFQSDLRTNIETNASTPATRDTVAPLPKSLSSPVRRCDAPTSVQDIAPDHRGPSIDASSTTNGTRRLATLRARYAEARRKQQQSLSQLRAIVE